MSNACLLIWASKYWTRHLCKRRRTSSLATQLNLELLSSCSNCAAQQTGHHESGTASLWGSAFSMPMWRCPGASLQSTRTSLYSIQSKPSQATHLLLRTRLLQRDQETELQSTARTESKNRSESQNSGQTLLYSGHFAHQHLSLSSNHLITHRIHGNCRFTYIHHKNTPNVDTYTMHGSYGLIDGLSLQSCFYRGVSSLTHYFVITVSHGHVRLLAPIIELTTPWGSWDRYTGGGEEGVGSIRIHGYPY